MKKAIALFVCIVLMLPAAGCGWGIHWGNGEVSGPGQLFDVNDHGEFALDGVDKITIITVSDDVLLQSGGEAATADLKGQCRSATKPVWLDARKEGSNVVFEVKYPQTVNFCDTSLTVIVPESYKGSLSIATVSGGIEAASLPFEIKQAKLKSVSGELHFGAASIESLDANTTSGDIDVTGITGPATVNSISGEIDLSYTAFARTTVTTVSGGVTARIPSDAAFKVEFGSVSGSFTSSHPNLGVSDADSGFIGTAAGGTETFKVNTTSGDFRIEAK